MQIKYVNDTDYINVLHISRRYGKTYSSGNALAMSPYRLFVHLYNNRFLSYHSIQIELELL